MEVFALPERARVDKVVPKNAFDSYAATRHKKLFSSLIARITWLYKLSPETVNLEGKDVKEIQIFKIELKVNEDPKALLDVIDKAIPYTIIFIVQYNERCYFSTSAKHPHPLSESNAVIDWTFKSEWSFLSANPYRLDLRKNLDSVYHAFCLQLAGKPESQGKELTDLVQYEAQKTSLEKEIERLKSAIKNCKQFNLKVELNLEIKSKQDELKKLYF